MIYTYSGQAIDPLNPKPEQILLEDIAYGLAGINRYNGQTRISVLRHSMALVNWLISKRCLSVDVLKYAALHDAAEAYLMDIPVPLKNLMSEEWKKAYNNFNYIILQKFIDQDPVLLTERCKLVNIMDKAIVEHEMDRAGQRERTAIRWPEGEMFMGRRLERCLNEEDYKILDGCYLWALEEDRLIEDFMDLFRPLPE